MKEVKFFKLDQFWLRISIIAIGGWFLICSAVCLALLISFGFNDPILVRLILGFSLGLFFLSAAAIFISLNIIPHLLFWLKKPTLPIELKVTVINPPETKPSAETISVTQSEPTNTSYQDMAAKLLYFE
jgi:hypothetical protein